MNKFILISLLVCLITMVMIGNEDGVEAGGHYSGSSNGDSRRRRRRTPGLGRRRRSCKRALRRALRLRANVQQMTSQSGPSYGKKMVIQSRLTGFPGKDLTGFSKTRPKYLLNEIHEH